MQSVLKHTLNRRIDCVDIDDALLLRIRQLLGREPRGMLGVYTSAETGSPAVVEVSCLVDQKPFPTLYWLIEPSICYRLDQLEASGVIAQLQAEVDGSDDMRRAMASDHAWYRAQRKRQTPEADLRQLIELGFASTLEEKGIGGISKLDRVRCLHTWYASHLVKPNVVGSWLDENTEV